MYKRIMVPLDGSETSEQVLPYVRLFARGLEAKVELVRVFESPPPELADPTRGIYLAQVAEAYRNSANDYLSEKASSLRDEGIETSTKSAEGDPASFIITEAELDPETLIAMSTHGRSGITRWVMGSVTDKVLRVTGYPMLIIHPKEEEPMTPEVELEDVIVPLDGSPLAEQVIPHALSLASAMGLGITLLRSIPSSAEYFMYMDYPQPNYDELYREVEENAQQYLDEMKVQVTQLGAPTVEARVVHGNAAEAITDYARDLPNSLVAMTTHGRSGVGRWVLGSIADRVVRHSIRPVLLVRAIGEDDD